MDFIFKLFQAGMAILQGSQLDAKQKEYNAAVQAQVKEGRSLYEARTSAAMNMISNDPNFLQARTIMRQLPRQAQEEMLRAGRVSEQNRKEFFKDYDKNTGSYLDEEKLSTAGFLQDLERQSGDISGGYAQREKDVLGVLEGQGEQALKDNRRSFGEQTGEAMGNLVSQGLSGSGVGASIRGGLATRESDQSARIREAVAAQRADAMSSLRGDTLGFGERAMTLGAGFRESGINRRLGARTGVESARAMYDSAQRGESMNARERAFDRVMGARTGRANWFTGQGGTALDTYLNTSGDTAAYLSGGPVQYAPPDASGFNTTVQSLGYGLGYQ